MKSVYTYMTAEQAYRLVEVIERALVQERYAYAYMLQKPNALQNNKALEEQKAKIARLTQRRVMAEEHLRRAQRKETKSDDYTC